MAGAVAETLSYVYPREAEGRRQRVVELILAREADASTVIAPGIAIPHAILDEDAKTELAVAVSKPGIDWHSSGDGEKVHVMVLLIGSRAAHLEALAMVVSLLRNRKNYERLLTAESPADIHAVFIPPAVADPAAYSERIIAHACRIRDDFPHSVTVIHSDTFTDLSALKSIPDDRDIILTATSEEVLDSIPFHGNMEKVLVPVPVYYNEKHVKFALVYLHSHGFLDGYERVVCISGGQDMNRIDSIRIFDVEGDIGIHAGLRDLELPSDIQRPVFAKVLQLAESLALEGREGKPVGAIFVVGDHQQVAGKSRQLIINPFKGYLPQQRSILDPVLDETIKEFAKIDGAFLITGDGVIESAGTFIAGQPESASHRPGLGSRHAAALGITAVTSAVAVVISESTRKISVFQGGKHFELD